MQGFFKKDIVPRGQVSPNEGKGFTLLYALLVISVVLVITTSIFSILLKEIRLASFGEASQIAYYAAEAGAECALYHATAPRSNPFNGTEDVTCGYGENAGNGSGVVNNAGSPFTFFIYRDELACAVVEVNSTGGTTEILSRGYNICPTFGSNTARVERGLRVVF